MTSTHDYFNDSVDGSGVVYIPESGERFERGGWEQLVPEEQLNLAESVVEHIKADTQSPQEFDKSLAELVSEGTDEGDSDSTQQAALTGIVGLSEPGFQ